MNWNSEHQERSAAEFINFIVVCLGFLTGVWGVILLSAAMAFTGLVLVALGLAYFAFKKS